MTYTWTNVEFIERMETWQRDLKASSLPKKLRNDLMLEYAKAWFKGDVRKSG